MVDFRCNDIPGKLATYVISNKHGSILLQSWENCEKAIQIWICHKTVTWPWFCLSSQYIYVSNWRHTLRFSKYLGSMSVVSRSRASKPPSVISTHRNGGTSTMQYETASQASRVPRTTVNSQSVSSRPINAITIPSSSTKGKVLGDQEITEEEMEHLAEVCRRCELLQRQEDERIKYVKCMGYFPGHMPHAC